MLSSTLIFEKEKKKKFADERIQEFVSFHDDHKTYQAKQGQVSIVIPTFNSSHLLNLVLDSILNSSLLPLEIIIVDDCSTKVDIKDYLGNYPCYYARLSKNYGPAIARNIGAKLARGKYVLFIDDDIELESRVIEKIERRFTENTDCSAVVGLLSPEHPNNDLLSRYKNFYMYFSLKNSPDFFGCLYTSISAVRKNVFDQYGGFDESHKRASVEDVDLGQRLNNAGEIVYLDKTLQVVHYKKYTLKTFIKNEYTRTYDLLSMLLVNNYTGKLFKQKRYLNNSPVILITTMLSGLSLVLWLGAILFPILAIVSASIFLIITILNAKFIKGYSKHNPFYQTVLIPFIIYLDFTIASIGISMSILHHIKRIFKFR